MIKEYKRAATIEEAVYLSGKGFVFLAGGTQVNSAPYKKWGRPVEKVLSLEALGLDGLKKEGGKLIIGAMVTLQDLSDSPAIPDWIRTAASFIPTRSVRNMATIGGNVGANRPDSYLIPALIASGALALLADERSLPVEQYIREGREDLILRFEIPGLPGTALAIKESRSHLALPVVSAAVRIAGEQGSVSEAVIAAGCVASRCIRLTDVEKGLVRGQLSRGEALEEAIGKSIDPETDIRGSASYKKYINSVVIADAVRSCLREVER